MPSPDHHAAFSLYESPGHISAHSGSVRHVIAWNEGTKPITVRTSVNQLVTVGGQCRIGQVPVTWATMRPAVIHLPPHTHYTATVRIGQAPPGTHLVTALFTGESAHRTGVHMTGAAGAAVTVHAPGHAAAPCKLTTVVHHHAQAAGPSATGPVIGLVAVGVLAVAIIITVAARRIRGLRRAH
jgi:hypothetical protein